LTGLWNGDSSHYDKRMSLAGNKLTALEWIAGIVSLDWHCWIRPERGRP
jgi:hypothetical protein